MLLQREEQEILRLEREWIKSMDQKDRDRHAAFDKIVAQQAAKEASFSMSTQAIINKQVRGGFGYRRYGEDSVT